MHQAGAHLSPSEAENIVRNIREHLEWEGNRNMATLLTAAIEALVVKAKDDALEICMDW